MKIKTEIVKGVFILTFTGSRINAMLAHGFFNAMQNNIQKGLGNIILDLSTIDALTSSELSMLVRGLKEIDGHGQLALCGVNGQVLDLLQKTHMDAIFIHAVDRDAALDDLLSGKIKESIGTVASACPVVDVEEEWLELVEVVSEEEVDTVQEPVTDERRKHRRIDHFQLLDEDIMVDCFNTRTGRQSTGIVLNISPGGIFMISTSSHEKGDEFIIQGNIGKLFKLKELAVVRSCRDGRYGLEFLNPSGQTVLFLNQLIGSVGLRKSN